MCNNCRKQCGTCEHFPISHPYGDECNKKSCTCVKFVEKTKPKFYQIVIEGSDYEQVQELFEEIQNKYSFYDNCVMTEVDKEDSIVGCCGKATETGKLDVKVM